MQKQHFEDEPKLLANPEACEARERELQAPHVGELTAFVDCLRAEKMRTHEINCIREIPYFDPWDGGTNAEVLFLAEAPGPKAVKSGFISRNNPDESAKNFFCLNHKAGICRKRTITWNVVPWYICTGTRIRSATDHDIQAGLPSLKKLLYLLPKLKMIVLVGKKAQRGLHNLSDIEKWRPDIKISFMWHPSPQCLNRFKDKRGEILEVLRKVALYLEKTGAA